MSCRAFFDRDQSGMSDYRSGTFRGRRVPKKGCYPKGGRRRDGRNSTTGPCIFFRVEDEHSRARYSDGKGLFAEDTKTYVDFGSRDMRLLGEVERQLDWRNKIPTPFISMYCDKSVAYREAERRVRAGKNDVKVYKIDMRKSNGCTEYRNIRRLAKKLGFHIPERAWNNSEFEYIFLHHVPNSAVVGWIDM